MDPMLSSTIDLHYLLTEQEKLRAERRQTITCYEDIQVKSLRLLAHAHALKGHPKRKALKPKMQEIRRRAAQLVGICQESWDVPPPALCELIAFVCEGPAKSARKLQARKLALIKEANEQEGEVDRIFVASVRSVARAAGVAMATIREWRADPRYAFDVQSLRVGAKIRKLRLEGASNAECQALLASIDAPSILFGLPDLPADTSGKINKNRQLQIRVVLEK